MKKRLIITSIILILLGIIFVTFMTYQLSERKLINEKIYSQDPEIQEAFKNYAIVTCEFNLLKPQKSFVSYQEYVDENGIPDLIFLRIDHYLLARNHLFSVNWNTQYTGGTTIENTTFDELVEMAKEDCSQFQEAKGDWRDETINWSYSPYTPSQEPEPEPEPKPKRTEEELQMERELILQQYE